MTSAPAVISELRQPVILPSLPFFVPAGELIPLQQHQVPDYMYLDDARRYEFPDRKQVIPGFVYAGVDLLAGRPGVGKTVLAMQWGMCVAMGVPFAEFVPEELGRVLVLDYENGIPQAVQTSRRISPWGSVATDGADAAWMMPWDANPPGPNFPVRLADLRARLEAARVAGDLFAMVVIDSMTTFFSPYPRNEPRDQHEGSCMRQLDRVGLEFQCGVVLLAHTNKIGEVAGSTQIIGGLTTAHQINREANEDAATLACIKNRAGPERNWQMKFLEGVWHMESEITSAQASNAGTKRLILDWLAEHGPAPLADICAGLPDVKPKTVSDLLSRLRSRPCSWVTQDIQHRWMIAAKSERRPEPVPAALAKCAVCHEPMTVIEPGQAAHPGCDPDGKLIRHPARPAPSNPTGGGPSADGEDQADDDGTCQVCGELRTGADTHPDCVPAPPGSTRWDSYGAMRATLARSRMDPVPCILPEDHPNRPPGAQHRGMPQWLAAIEADRSAEAGFRWTRPGLPGESGPDHLVVTFDRSQSFTSAASSVPLAANVLTHTGPLDRDPRELGKIDPHKKPPGPAGLAGVAELIVPAWDHPEMPHPLGRRAVPGERTWFATGALEELWKLHRQGLIERPVVTDSYTGRRTVGLLDPYAEAVRDARRKAAGDPEMLAAVKRSASIGLRVLYPIAAKSPWWRPDWRAGNVTEAGLRHWWVAWRAVRQGAILAGLGNVDTASFLVPEGADPGTWVPPGYKLGTDPGTVHPGVIRVRADQCDLAGIDPARITPSGHPKFAEIAGPVPLHVWLMRRG
jgi:hypothetical protein